MTLDDLSQIATLRHKVANTHDHIGRHEEAEKIADELLWETESEEGRKYFSDRLYLLVMREEVETCKLEPWTFDITRSGELCERMQLALPYFKEGCRHSSDRLGIYYSTTWATQRLVTLLQISTYAFA